MSKDMTVESGDDLFKAGAYSIPITFQNNDPKWDSIGSMASVYAGFVGSTCPERVIEGISLMIQADADAKILAQKQVGAVCGMPMPHQAATTITFKFSLGQSAFLYIAIPKYPDRPVNVITAGAVLIGERVGYISGYPNLPQHMDVYRISNGAPASPGPLPLPLPPGNISDVPPVLADCSFPAFTPNLWAYFGALFEWIGCILHNIIAILQWVVDWFLRFPDHLDAWVSRLFGIDPALPFFDELMKKIDIWISNRLGVDPTKPLLDEIAKKVLSWLFEALNDAALNGIERLR